jgi:hypothetical protein
LNHVERGASVQENKKDHNNVPGILSLYHYRQRSRSMDKAAIADPAIWTITGVVYFEEKYSSGNCVQITASIDGKTIEDIIPGSVLGLKQKDYRRIDQAIKRQKM